jgi:hypothetical protein
MGTYTRPPAILRPPPDVLVGGLVDDLLRIARRLLACREVQRVQASRRADQEEQVPRRIDRAGGRDPPRTAFRSPDRAQVAPPDDRPGRRGERVNRSRFGRDVQEPAGTHPLCERGGIDGAVEIRGPVRRQPGNALPRQRIRVDRVPQLVVIGVARPRGRFGGQLRAHRPGSIRLCHRTGEGQSEHEQGAQRRDTAAHGDRNLRDDCEYSLKPARRTDRPRAARPRSGSCRPGFRRPRALPSSPGPFPRSRR